jgi:hypothetical protein
MADLWGYLDADQNIARHSCNSVGAKYFRAESEGRLSILPENGVRIGSQESSCPETRLTRVPA